MAHVAGVFQDNLTKSISESKVLMVGAGGIGCELLKNIVLTGKNTVTFTFMSSSLVLYFKRKNQVFNQICGSINA